MMRYRNSQSHEVHPYSPLDSFAIINYIDEWEKKGGVLYLIDR
jgi:hypothetical protein